MVSRLAFLAFLLLFLSVSLGGCGMLGFGGEDGDSGDPEEMDLIDFGDEGEPTPVPEEVVRVLHVDPNVLEEIHFLYNFQVRLEGLREVIRDLISAAEYSGPGDVDLDWVADVHEVTRESDSYFGVLTSMDVPENQRRQYEYLYIGMLETVQVAGYGADRLLASAVVVGPTGRSMLNMSGEEIDEFQTLMRESKFFLADSEGRVNGSIKEVGQAVGGLRVR